MRSFEAAAAALALVTALVGGTVTVDSRYAKSYEMQRKLDDLYSKTLRLKILELQLKPPDSFSAADKALLEHLQRELQEASKD